MNFKKLSLAAAISISMITAAGIAQSAQAGTCPQTGMQQQGTCPIKPRTQTQFQMLKRTPNPCPVCPSAPEPCPVCPPQQEPCPTGGASPCPICPTEPQCPPQNPCPVCPEEPQCPPKVTCPVCPPACPEEPVCPEETGAAVSLDNPVCATCPNVNPDAEYTHKQVYAYPSISSSSVVVPSTAKVVQIGGEAQDIAVGEPVLLEEGVTGAAAPVFTPQAVQVETRDGVKISKAPPCKTPGCPITIQTPCGIEVERIVQVPVECPTGAAAPVESQFSDVCPELWANRDINRLAMFGVVAGYPDRSFRPTLPILRSELASILVSGLNLENVQTFEDPIFNDVPESNWANNDIDKAYNKGLVAGYPDNNYRPHEAVTRAEALATMAKTLPGKLSASEAENVLGCYKDSAAIPSWARIAVAEALNAGLAKDFPEPDYIKPNQSASRAEVTSMMSQLRQELALQEPDITGAAAEVIMQPQKTIVTVPILSLKFEDQITARASHVGDRFAARTQEPINIDCLFFPKNSKVTGKVVEIIRPNGGNNGAIKVAFDEISYEDQKTMLPKEILSATVLKEKHPNFIARTLGFPFIWPGRVVGTIGRTLGGATMIVGNTAEEMLNSTGIAATELFSGKLAASGRSVGRTFVALGQGVWDVGKTGVSGTAGILRQSGQELAYVVTPKGTKVSSINPNEEIRISFGCE